MKRFFCFLLISLFVSLSYAQEDIATARLKVNSTITVGGIVTNGIEMGGIRYFQDHTGGICAYGYDDLKDVKAGDSIVVTGKLVDYNNLLEISPITSFTLVSSGHPMPEAVEITPSQVGESYESQLVYIKGVNFTNAGSIFEGNKNYNFTADGESGMIRINRDATSIIGQLIPSGFVDLIAICSQYSYNENDTITGYQLLPRTIDDFLTDGSIHFSSPISIDNITKTSFTLSWKTNTQGTSEVSYGYGPDIQDLTGKQSGSVTPDGDDFLNVVELTDLKAGSIIYVNAYTFDQADTTQSSIKAFATQSNSSGEMKAFFNTEVDHSVSNVDLAVFLHQAIDDTLIAYINRAQESIDFTIYNFNNSNISNISEALNAAHNRGVKVRIISCGTANNFAIADLDINVPRLSGPDENNRDGIMHNKFVVFDAHSSDPNVPMVWTGATNFTDGQINKDPNNVIVVQDQSLALTYEIEFEEMWGSNTSTPNPELARFGAFKKDNTPHDFIIGGKKVGCYFSPSDGTNQKILESLNSADNDLSIATMLLTRSDIAYSIRDSKQRGVAVNMLTNQAGGNTDLVNEILSAALGVQHYVFNEFVPGIMHHKYAIIDQGAPESDPILITGSHNWSNSANDRNDENTLIIHDASIANIYYQQFVQIFEDNHGSFFEITSEPKAVNDSVYVEKNGLVTVDVIANDEIESAIVLEIVQGALFGQSYIPFTNPKVINYQAKNDFIGLDSIQYQITYQTDASLSDLATIYLSVGTTGINYFSKTESLSYYPNPVKEKLTLNCSSPIKAYAIYNAKGVFYFSEEVSHQKEVTLDLNLDSGIYIMKVSLANMKTITTKIVVQ